MGGKYIMKNGKKCWQKTERDGRSAVTDWKSRRTQDTKIVRKSHNFFYKLRKHKYTGTLEKKELFML